MTNGNIPEWSVTELSGALKRTLEDAFGHVRLRGEISGYRGPHSSGHVYFTIKDASAKIEAVIWRGAFQKLTFKPEEGLEVIAIGKITTFAGKSSYQIVVEHLEPAGVGALMALLEARKRTLASEGLFDESRKRAPPYLPHLIGVITSPTGAVIRDILHRLRDRFARDVIVWPVRVQGETSAGEIVRAIEGFNALPKTGGVSGRPDVILIARGGGSLEDLWSFNEENVVRAVAQSTIPIVSAIGHETDWTLIDLVADKRAPTPTGAAEMVVPVRAQLMDTHLDLSRRHYGAMQRIVGQRRADVRALARALPSATSLIEPARQNIDMLSLRLSPALLANARTHETRLKALSTRLNILAPHARLARFNAQLLGHHARLKASVINIYRTKIQKFDHVAHRTTTAHNVTIRHHHQRIITERTLLLAVHKRLSLSFERLLTHRFERINHIKTLLESLSHKNVLARGYVIVRDNAGGLIKNSADAQRHESMTLTFADADVTVYHGISPSSSSPKITTKAVVKGVDQGKLF